MESKQIYIKAHHLLAKGRLDELPLGGWKYCGRSDDLKVSEITQAIEQYFPYGQIYFVSTRHDSRLEEKSNIISIITSTIDDKDFMLWSEDFCQVMEFKSIGVFRFRNVCE